MDQEQKPRERSFISELVPDWRPTKAQVLWAIRITIVFVIVLGILTFIGLPFGISLWGWVKLLIVPAVIAGGGLWFNAQQREREQRIANERAQDEALQAYLDAMSQLLTDNEQPLHSAQPGDSLSTLARARTLTVLGRLDGARKASVLQFLYESRLIDKEPTRLNLEQANLSGAALKGANLREANLPAVNLSGAELIGTDLSDAFLIKAKLHKANMWGTFLGGAILRGANLREATLPEVSLQGANLIGADLSEADLSKAKLMGADLSNAILRGANLRGADLSGATLSGANLRGADLSEAGLTWANGWTEDQLSTARTLVGATMPNLQTLQGDAVPDGPTFEKWLKDKKAREEDRENDGSS